ncbi:MAG TPA: ATP-binding cassette domain-containing protein [Leucothrix mucor]|nr:ATP-binding cassette domain-containing protein [Leucothrix mucor]
MKIPFGKYKGKPIEVLENDLGYAKWILEQAWFAQKHPELHEAILTLYEEQSEGQASKALESKENFLLSIALKKEKIESYDNYPFSLPVVKNLERTLLHPHVTYIVGENGSGKSTLLEALAISQGFNAEGGTTNFNFSTRTSHSDLHEYLRIAKGLKKPRTGFFLRAESFYNVATEIENLGVINSYGSKPLHEQSHGEAFLSLMKNRFGDNGLYVLDEPEAALSPNRQMSILTLIHDLIKQGSQFIISTHSPILLSYPSATIYEIGDSGLEEISYEETNTFKISKQFLNNYDAMLEVLLE